MKRQILKKKLWNNNEFEESIITLKYDNNPVQDIVLKWLYKCEICENKYVENFFYKNSNFVHYK